MAAARAESGSWEELSLPTELKLSTGPSSDVEQVKNESGNGQKENSSEQHCKTKESTSKKLCGFLEKQGEKGIIKTWKRRWFVFQARRCRLYYYRNPDDPSELGYIDINDATFAMNISSGRMDQFDIRIANRVYHLQAQDQQTALYWLQELQAQRREYSRKITAMCHHSEVDVVPEPSESPGLITAVVPDKIQEEDDSIFEAIPAPETVGENAARRPQDGRSGISIKHMKTEIKNFASKRQSVIVTPTQVLPDTVPRSSSMSEDASTKRSTIGRKMFSTRSSSATTDRAFPECPQCRKLGLQLEACTAKLEETEEYAQAREEAIVSLNQYIREFVLDKSLRDNLQSEELKDNDEKDKYIKQLERKLRIQEKELSNCKKEIAMLKEVISSKDEVVIKTTNELATVYGTEESPKKSRKSSESNLSQPNEKIVPFSNLGSSGETFRSFLTHIENLETDKEKVGKLKEALRAYIAQNSFLNSEVVELNKLRKDDTERIRTYIVKNQTQEADLCRIKSKFYLLVQEVHAPVKDGQSSLPQEVISQLLEEAIEIESQSKKTEEGSQTPFDRYGFYTKLERGDEDALAAVAGKLNRRSDEIVKASTNGDVRQTSVEVKWENYMMINRNKEFQKTPELKNLIRSGIPHDFRAKIWLSCVNIYVKATKRVSGSGYYERLLASKKDCFSPAVKQIGLDLLRTLPNNKFYDKQGADGIDQLRRVLLAFSWHNQDIGYCQGLNRLAAIALLYLSEEDSFWALVALVEFVMPKDYYSKTLITSQSDQRVLKDILAEKIPKVSEHLDKLNIDLSLVTFNWFLTAFVDSVPIEIVLRIWDTLLYEGTKVLFRFAVAIFRVNEAKILEITDNMKMFTFLRNMPSKLTNDDKLFQVAFQGLNPFPMQKITSLREFHHSALKVELAELDKLRREYVETKNEKSSVVVSDGET